MEQYDDLYTPNIQFYHPFHIGFQSKKRNLEDMWVEAVEAHPGLNTGALCQHLGKSTDDKSLAAARKAALYYKRVKTVGVGSATIWYPMGASVPIQMQTFAG